MIRLAIYALAIYRFTLLLYEEEGPFRIFARIRVASGIRNTLIPNQEGSVDVIVHATGFWAELLNCPYCLSGWLSLLAVIGYRTRKLDWLAWWGGVWGIVHWMLRKQGY